MVSLQCDYVKEECMKVVHPACLSRCEAMKNRTERKIAMPKAEAAMAETHANRLARMAPHLMNAEHKRELLRLSEEEAEKAEALRRQITLLRGRS